MSKMGILLSWQQVVASILFLARCASSQLSDPSNTSSLDDKPFPIKISSIQFEDEPTKSVRINIYDSQLTFNRKIYFYSPLARLNPLNVVSIHNETITGGILSIGFRIWNENLDNKVAQHLTQFLNQKVETNQVLVFPFNRLRLTSKVLKSADFSLTNEWVKYQNQQQLRLTLTCTTKEDCSKVKKQINNNEFENVIGLEFDPPLNADDGSSSQEDSSSIQVKELIKRLADFTKEMNAFREEALQNLETTRIELQQTKDAVEDLTKKLNARTSEIVDIGIMPTSCSDLQRMGHKLSGFFSVKGSGKIEIVYCNFLSNGKDLQKWIGHAVVKSTPVHFYVGAEYFVEFQWKNSVPI